MLLEQVILNLTHSDISVIQKLQNTIDKLISWVKTANELMNKIETGPKPVVAAINGFALGGGLEISISCNAR